MTGEVNFGMTAGSFHPYHNAANPYNVNNDVQNTVAPIDALLVINWINANGGAEGEISPGQNPGLIGYIDVNDDGLCTPVDALMVINYINSHPTGGGEGEAAANTSLQAGSSSSTGEAGEGQGQGPGQFQVPQNASMYYAQNPIHLQNIPGTDQPCTCAACMAARAAAAGQTATSAPASRPQASSSPLDEAIGAIAADVSRASGGGSRS